MLRAFLVIGSLSLAAPTLAAPSIEPSVPIFIDASVPHEGKKWSFGTSVIVYDLLHPELGVSGTAGFTWEPKEFTGVHLGVGMGVMEGLAFPVIHLRGNTLLEPVLLWTQAEYTVGTLDDLTLVELFYSEYTAVGVEGEVFANFEDGTVFRGVGPNLFFLPTETAWVGFSWQFADAGNGLFYNPRVYVMLTF